MCRKEKYNFFNLLEASTSHVIHTKIFAYVRMYVVNIEFYEE